VVVLNWNTRAHVARCVERLLAQDSNELAIVVVDNASSDGSRDVIAGLNPSVTPVCLHENIGFAKANNRAATMLLDIAPSIDALAFLNADTAVRTPRAVQCLRELALERPDVGIAVPRLVNADGSLQRSVAAFPTLGSALAQSSGVSFVAPDRWRPRLGTRWSHGYSARVPWAKGAALVIRRDAWEAVGGFDESNFMYGEDLDLCWRAARGGWATWFAHDVVVEHEDDASTSQIWDDETRALRAVDATVGFLRRELPMKRRLVSGVTVFGLAGRSLVLALLRKRVKSKLYWSLARKWFWVGLVRR
jgi:N-acetylglucosaminyl-diphospho-decaprenol L-rhamnosyltransferase